MDRVATAPDVSVSWRLRVPWTLYTGIRDHARVVGLTAPALARMIITEYLRANAKEYRG